MRTFSLSALVLLWLAFIVGWVLNIVQVCKAATITGFVIVKIVGIFLGPIGAVLGWVGVFW